MGMAGGSGGLSSSSSARTGDLYEAPRTNYIDPTFGAGNRGFINNFAESGANLSSDESINPTKTPGDFALWIVFGAVVLTVIAAGVWLLKKA
jgi:hypothetical protein